jgi:hypothetical protein
MTKSVVAFRNFANAPRKVKQGIEEQQQQEKDGCKEVERKKTAYDGYRTVGIAMFIATGRKPQIICFGSNEAEGKSN